MRVQKGSVYVVALVLFLYSPHPSLPKVPIAEPSRFCVELYQKSALLVRKQIKKNRKSSTYMLES